jgi:hypothetical protein
VFAVAAGGGGPSRLDALPQRRRWLGWIATLSAIALHAGSVAPCV